MASVGVRSVGTGAAALNSNKKFCKRDSVESADLSGCESKNVNDKDGDGTTTPAAPLHHQCQQQYRKRSHSIHSGAIAVSGGRKRRRFGNGGAGGMVQRTQFLLGGNICDPLNLGSLTDEASRLANACTPECSPVPTPRHRRERLDVIIPHDVSDPLGLNTSSLSPSCSASTVVPSVSDSQPSGPPAASAPLPPVPPPATQPSDEAATSTADKTSTAHVLLSPAKSGDKLSQRSRCVSGDGENETVLSQCTNTRASLSSSSRSTLPLTDSLTTSGQSASNTSLPPVVTSPLSRDCATASSSSRDVIVDSQAALSGGDNVTSSLCGEVADKTSSTIAEVTMSCDASATVDACAVATNMTQTKRRRNVFEYGNYNRYYGYRNPSESDPRLRMLRRHWVHNCDVLDIGCNVGHVTLAVARDHAPRRCVGLDIDLSLIKTARKNVRRYERGDGFPASMSSLYGQLTPHVSRCTQQQQQQQQRHSDSGEDEHNGPAIARFPANVSFVHANFVLESDAQLATVRAEFHLVLCLSVTKWVHLNHGDNGLRRFFRRILLTLRPGGRLVLEPQPWPSYVKKKKTTPRIWQNFQSLRLRPESFPDLLVNEIGFHHYESLGRPHHNNKGFNRQLQLYVKADEQHEESRVDAPPGE